MSIRSHTISYRENHLQKLASFFSIASKNQDMPVDDIDTNGTVESPCNAHKENTTWELTLTHDKADYLVDNFRLFVTFFLAAIFSSNPSHFGHNISHHTATTVCFSIAMFFLAHTLYVASIPNRDFEDSAERRYNPELSRS